MATAAEALKVANSELQAAHQAATVEASAIDRVLDRLDHELRALVPGEATGAGKASPGLMRPLPRCDRCPTPTPLTLTAFVGLSLSGGNRKRCTS